MFERKVFPQVTEVIFNRLVVLTELGVEFCPQRMARFEANTTASLASLASCYATTTRTTLLTAKLTRTTPAALWKKYYMPTCFGYFTQI